MYVTCGADEAEYSCWEEALFIEATALGAEAKALLFEAAGAEYLCAEEAGAEWLGAAAGAE